MSGIRDTATVTLNVNGAQAKQMMSELDQKVSDTKKKISDLKAAMADPKDIEKARKELKSYQKKLDEVRSATQGVESALSNLDSATPRQLEKALRTLNKQLKDIPPGSETWDSHIEKIKELKARLEEIKDETREHETLWDKFKSWSADAWPAIDLLNQWGGSFVDLARSAVDAFAEMDQEMANVRKFTGMTEDQVEELNEEFKKMDTRTSREDLNKLAQEAGRLGKTSKEDVLGFVRAADKINVALDDLGEGATLTLSKLTGIFGDEKIYGTEQSLLKVGSVINELSQNCSASAPYLAEFASRMGGVGAQAGMTIQQIMGFAAVLDSNEQKVEASSTALSQVLVRMMQDPAKYARVAGLDVQEFTTMLKEDANGALLMFLDTLQKAGGMDVLSPMFKDMGENGSRAIAALSTLATHIDEVKAQQEAANVAFKEGISIDNEFNVQNNTVQAGLDKCAKAAQDIRVELGERLAPLMSHMLSSTSAIMRALLTTVNFLIDNKTAILSLTAAIAAYNIALNLVAIKTKIVTIAQKAWNIAVVAGKTILGPFKLAVAAVTNAVQYFTNGLQVSYAMQQRWRAALAATNWAALTAAIIAAGAALLIFRNRTNEAAEAQKTLNDVKSEAAKRLADEKTKIDILLAAARNEKLSLEERHKAIAALNKIIPNYNAQLDATTGKYSENKKALDEYLKSLAKKYELEGAREKLASIGKEKAEATIKQQEAKKAYDRNQKEMANANYLNGQYTTSFGMVGNSYFDASDHLRRNLDEANDKLSIIEAKENAVLKVYGVDLQKQEAGSAVNNANKNPTPTPTPTPTGTGGGGRGGSATDRFAAEKAWREKEEALARISYAKGESDYEEYTVKMSQIQVDYNQKLLDRDDVSGNERLKIQADYWEATNKYTQAQHTQSVSIENASYEESVRALNEAYVKKLEAGNMSAEDREAAEKTHQEALELAELEHFKRLTTITKEGSEERNKAEQQYRDARLRAAQRHQQEYEKTQQEHEKRRASFKDKYFGLNATEKQAAYDADIATLTEVYNAEILAAGNNADEKLRIEESFQAAKLALQKQYDQLAEEDNRNAMQRSIESYVEWLNGDGGKALTGTLNTLVSGMSSIFSGLSSMMQAELEIQTSAIKKRYDAEIDRAEGNSYRIRKLEKQRDAEQAKAKKEANRKMFALQVIQAVAQTATNALNAYGSAAAVPVVGYILAPIAAAMAVAAGAIQIAAIKKQQQASESQGFSKGGFTKPGAVDEPAGIVHAGEWVASQKLLANPVARPMIEALDYAQRTNTIGSLKAEDVSRSIRANDSLVRMAEYDGSNILVASAVAHNTEAVDRLNDRLQKPLGAIVTVTGDHGINKAQDEYDQYIRNKNPKLKK